MTVVKLHVLLFLFYLQVKLTFGARIFYDKCDYKGFTCVKSKTVPGKYDITYECSNIKDVEFNLWQFRAPITITTFKIANCSKVTLDLTCPGKSQAIQLLVVKNVTNLVIVPPNHTTAHTSPEVIFEDIGSMSEIPSRTFMQVNKQYGCSTPSKELESITLRNVRIDSIQREAFHNLVEMKTFIFQNVTVDRIHAAAIQVYMAEKSEMQITDSNIGVMEFLSLVMRGTKLRFYGNSINEMYPSAINATVFCLAVTNNSFNWLHSSAFSVLTQNVTISDNTFNHLSTGAFQAIGPGLPENSLRGFGSLHFIYEFQNNLVESLDVASLHPDYRAYKNVGHTIKFAYNAVKCSCAEIKWISMKDSYSKHFAGYGEFYAQLLKMENNNICSDGPCILPLETVRLMMLKDERCLPNITQEYMCSVLYYSTTDLPTSVLPTNKTGITPTKAGSATQRKYSNAIYYQKRISLKSSVKKYHYSAVLISINVFLMALISI